MYGNIQRNNGIGYFIRSLFNYNYSRNKGTVKAGDTFNSSLNMGPSNSNYSSDLVKDEPVEIAADGTIVLNWAPVKVDTFSIKVTKADGSVVKGYAQPGSFGTITGDITGDVTPAGTVVLTNSESTSVKLSELVAGTATVTYKFDNTSVREDGFEATGFTNAPSAELQIKSVPVNAKTRTLRAYWALTSRQVPRCSNVA